MIQKYFDGLKNLAFYLPLGSDTSESMRIISAESSSSPPMASSSEPAAELSSLAKAVAAVLIY